MPALKQMKNPSITAFAKYCFLFQLFIPVIIQRGFSFQEGYGKFFVFGHHL